MMNTLKKITTSILVVAVVGALAGCGEYLGGGTNDDPNKLSREQVGMDALLPPVLVESGRATFNVGFTFGQYAQHISFEATTDEQEPTRLNGAWTNIYLRALNNAEVLVEKAQEQGSPHYLGIAKVVQAYNLGLATTAWEDVPWSNAFVDGELTPSYDSQESIYNTINTLLDDAITELQKEPSEFNSPGDDDIVYGGNADQWIRLAYALKARFAIHLTNKGTVDAANNALSAAQNAMQGNGDDFQVKYNGEKNLNPWHTDAVLSARTGNPFPIHSDQLIDIMKEDGTYPEFDPRLPIIADKGDASGYFGSVNGVYGTNPDGPDNSSTVNFTADTYYSRAAAPILMMTYAELKFIEAEAQFLVDNNGDPKATGASQAAYDAYMEGIRAHMDKLGVAASDRDAYMNAPSVDVGANDLTMDLIMKEKFVALFTNPEAFTDLRRYDFDSDIFKGLELPEEHNPELNGQWIKRALYPNSELSRNQSEVPNVQPENPMWFMTN
jgi:hypothetical protein